MVVECCDAVARPAGVVGGAATTEARVHVGGGAGLPARGAASWEALVSTLQGAEPARDLRTVGAMKWAHRRRLRTHDPVRLLATERTIYVEGRQAPMIGDPATYRMATFRILATDEHCSDGRFECDFLIGRTGSCGLFTADGRSIRLRLDGARPRRCPSCILATNEGGRAPKRAPTADRSAVRFEPTTEGWKAAEALCRSVNAKAKP